MHEYIEGRQLELKETLTDSFLKTVSAFSNYQSGQIVFGVKDNGEIVGVKNSRDFVLNIENKINDSIEPRPKFTIDIVQDNGLDLIVLNVYKGQDVPYLYKGRAYQRADTSSVPLDAIELRRLSLQTINLDYDQLPSSETDLTFYKLEEYLIKIVGINSLTTDIIKTLGLIRDERYTIAGELLADENNNRNSRTHIVRFGLDSSIFIENVEFKNQSLLKQYEGALEMFRKWYSPYEKIEGMERVEKIQIPEEAFREALANSLVHRRYDLSAAIQISMHQDRIEIVSPGGLPEGMSKSSYLTSQESLLRNVTIAEVFHRLRLIEKFGTGIARIKKSYENLEEQPSFEINDSFIKVILPVIGMGYNTKPNDTESKVLNLLSGADRLSRKEIEDATGYSKSQILNILNNLIDSDKVEVVGAGRSTTYRLK